jgi:hypothetical protein
MKESTVEIVKDNPQLELLKDGASIVRMENSTQMQIAIQHPRDEKAILDAALAELDIYPSMAKEAWYVRPVGKEEGSETQKNAEGLSIRAAESLANRWTNSSYGTTIVEEDDDSIKLAAVFLDYEKNIRHVTESRVSKFITRRDKSVQRLTPDRLDLKVKAETSKILRERILRSLPPGLRKEYENKVKAILGGSTKKGGVTLRDVLETFSTVRVFISQIEKYMGKPKDQWSKDDLITLLGIANSIKDGERTVDDVFAQKDDKPENGLGLKVQ